MNYNKKVSVGFINQLGFRKTLENCMCKLIKAMVSNTHEHYAQRALHLVGYN